MFDEFKAIPMWVKIAVAFLCLVYGAVLVALPAKAALALCTASGVVCAMITILRYLLNEE